MTQTVNRRRVFISYGRADAAALAFRLEEDLVRRGHSVWLDRSRLETGRSWEEQIENAILTHEIFICLLTPHAVRRPDGVCLDEISMARYNNRRIIPAMVIDCRQPLGIYRLNWVDFKDWENPARYEKCLRDLAAAIEENQEVEGEFARLFSNLKPLDFGLEIARLTRDFTGREWLLERLKSWESARRGRVFFVIGDPGTGKSAFLAWLVHRHPSVAAYHFCVSSLADSLDPVRFVRSIAAQLATQLPGYRSALAHVDIQQLAETDASSLFRRLIAGPLQAEGSDLPALIIVDALDESLAAGDRNIASILRDRLDDLPSRVSMVFSSRNQPEILDMFSDYDPEWISAESAENRSDVDLYIQRRLEEPAFKKILETSGIDRAGLAAAMGIKSEGNFLYVTQLIRGIESGRIDPARPDAFPHGLVGIYHAFFERLFPGGTNYDETRLLLSILCASRESLAADRIAAFAGLEVDVVERRLQTVVSFFPCRDGHYEEFHKSILDWLTGTAGKNATFRVNLKGGHRRIADRLTTDFQGGRPDRFTLAHLPSHLLRTEAWEELTALLTDIRFVALKSAAGMTFGLVRDYEDTLESLPEGLEGAKAEREQSSAVRAYLKNLVAFSRGQSSPLQIISSLPPWTNERISRENQRETEHPRSIDRVTAFARFVNSEAHHLFQYGTQPGFCLQQARNSASSGPVAEAAGRLLEASQDIKALLKSGPSVRAFIPNPALVRILEGQECAVLGVAVAGSGDLAVSAGENGRVGVWNLTSGECLGMLTGHEGAVKSVDLTPDGSQAITGGDDKLVRVWDLRAMQCVGALPGHTAAILAVRILPRGGRAVTVGKDRTLKIWDLDESRCVRTLRLPGGRSTCLAVSADGQRAISGSKDHLLRTWDLEEGVCMRELAGHQDAVLSVAMTPDGRRAVSGSVDGTLRVWDPESGREEVVCDGHKAKVRCVDLSADGRLAISGGGSFDRSVRLWDLERGTCLRVLEGHTDSIYGVRMSPDGRLAVSAAGLRDQSVRVWNLTNGYAEPLVPGHGGGVWSIAPDPEFQMAVSCAGSRDPTLRVWDLSSGECGRVLEGHAGAVWSAGLLPGTSLALSGSKDRSLRLWDTTSGACLAVCEEPDGDVWSLCPFWDGRAVLTGSEDHALRLWDLKSRKIVREYRGHEGPVWRVALLPDMRTALSGSRDRTMRLWNLATGECLRVFDGHTDAIWSLDVSPDGRFAVSASLDHTLRVWDLRTGACKTVLKGHRGGVLNAVYFCDGRKILSSSYDKTIRVWDPATGETGAVLPETAAVTAVSRIRKETRLAYGTSNGLVALVVLKGFADSAPVVTAYRIGTDAGTELDAPVISSESVLCESCGKIFPAPPPILERIARIEGALPGCSSHSPCLFLPDSAWQDAGLKSKCPHCRRSIRFNPFVADSTIVLGPDSADTSHADL